jgi:catechol 2,3-dioxygenase-like lactoylglutathione lyase family enzyme
MRSVIGGVALALLLAGAAAAEPPANLRPRAISGPGWNVMNLDAQKAWYMDKLGMKPLRSYDRDGKPFEWIMGYDAPGGAILALLASPNRKPGPNGMARLILQVPDSKALADWLKTQGVESRMVAPGAYFINDPEGNPVELYTPPPPAPPR